MLVGAALSSQDPVQLQARLAAVTALLEERTSVVEQLRAERDTANAEVDKLRVMIRQLLRAQYGRRSETLDPDQLQLGLEEVEQSLGIAMTGGAGAAAAMSATKAARAAVGRCI